MSKGFEEGIREIAADPTRIEEALASIAISLRRIADAHDGLFVAVSALTIRHGKPELLEEFTTSHEEKMKEREKAGV